MSIRVMSLIFNADIQDGENSSASARKLVLLAMADYAADDGSGIYPSRRTLEKKTALSSGGLNYAIKSLVADKHIKKVGQRPHTAVVVYQLNVKKLMSEQFDTTSTIEVPPSTIEVPYPQPLRDTTSTIEENPLVNRQIETSYTAASAAKRKLTPLQEQEQSLIDLFCQLTGIPELDHKHKSFGPMWAAPMGQLVKAANGSGADCLTQAIERLRQRGMTIATPKSAINTALAIYGEQNSTTGKRVFNDD